MIKYHKIHTVFKRDPNNKHKTLLEGEFSLPEFEYLQNNEWVFSEKVNGENVRIKFDGKKITFGGREDNAQLSAILINKLIEMFLPKLNLFKEMFKDANVCLYGEGYGKKIQKVGYLYRNDQGFVLFDIRIGDWWLKRSDVVKIALDLGIDVVPVIGSGTLWDMVELCRKGFNSNWGDFLAEGIVARPAIELKARNGKRIITKLKHKDFINGR